MTSEDNSDKTTHFGYRSVPYAQKSTLVAEVFDNVAAKYDLMNDLMSFGMHRLWKKFTISSAALRPGQKVLDVASGTGDLAKAFAKIVGANGKVIMTDINESMLTIGRDRLVDTGIIGNIECVQADAENLPFQTNYFDCVTIAFGLRNVTNKEAALRSMYRVLKPGGKLLILEFSHAENHIINQFYDFYSFNVIPTLGKLVTGSKESYQYLVESIRKHPTQEKLKTMLQEAGFEDIDYFNLSGGIVALHKGFKF